MKTVIFYYYLLHMRKAFLFVMIFLCTHCFAQEWSVLKIDSNLSMKLPPYINLVDTFYEVSGIRIKTIAAFIDSGKIVLTKGRYPKNVKPIKTERLLSDFYNGVREGLVNTVKGELVTDTVIELNGLKVQWLRINFNYEGEPCVLHYLGFLLNQNKYSLQVIEATSKEAKIGNNISDLLIFSGSLSLKKQLTL